MLAGSPPRLAELAGIILLGLWREYPSLITEFVTNKHVPALLNQLPSFSKLRQGRVLIMLVQDVWSHTAALVSEPLLTQAISRLVYSCRDLVNAPQELLQESDSQQALNLQVCL